VEGRVMKYDGMHAMLSGTGIMELYLCELVTCCWWEKAGLNCLQVRH
jgi:hypothetical protein